MAISTIRRADQNDINAVRAVAVRFCKRHNIVFDADQNNGAEQAIEFAIGESYRSLTGRTTYDNARLHKLWVACYCRALNVPVNSRTTIAYGYVGLRAK
jgi:hypothetical protein